jgi:fatty acid kinase fatty acid binding subunit
VESKTGRRIAIVTDSTADIPRNLVEQYGISVIPQILIMGDKTWRDGVDIDPPAFYELLRTSPHFPASSQPSVVSFQELFTRLAEKAEGIVAVLISNELSGTLNSARMAASNLPDVPIEIIDSRAVSMQLGFIVLAAARAAAAGGNLSTVVEAARATMGKAGVYFTVDTLEYLHRGGRIGAAAKLFGTALNLKPVLNVRDGVVSPVTKVRTRRKALDTLLQELGEQWAGSTRVHAAVLHVAAPDDAAELAARVEAELRPVEIMSYECGPVIGCHAGPGTVGVAYYVE